MRRAIRLANKGWGATHPNPMVGAVIVDDASILSEGYHSAAGKPHAEVVAINQLKSHLSESLILYVTLEPCSTAGRTPACTDAIIQSGLKHVVIGATDPNPRHEGRGIDILRNAGINVRTGVLSDVCEDLNMIFNHWITRRTPFIAGKTASTLDGRIATRLGCSKWITGEQARKDVMRWRKLFPAIAVGADTVLTDDPSLTSRLNKKIFCPIRFIFDGKLRTFAGRLPKVYVDEFKERTIVIAYQNAERSLRTRLEKSGINVWEFQGGNAEDLFSKFRERCCTEEITGVLCEGGSNLLSSLLNTQNLDYFFSYRSSLIVADESALPMLKGRSVEDLAQGINLSSIKHLILGNDQLMRGLISYHS